MKPRLRGSLAFWALTLALLLSVVALGEWRQRAALTAARHAELRRAVELLSPDARRLFSLPVADADAEIRRWAAASGLRVTLIAPDGRVMADSWTLPALLGRLENHAGRPELRAAVAAGSVAVTRRRSTTTDQATVYAARQVDLGAAGDAFLRVAREQAPRPFPWSGVLGAVAAASLLARWVHLRDRRRHRAVARHLQAWTELPPAAEPTALAEEADRCFRALREGLTREIGAARAALTEIAEGVVMLDDHGVVRFANPAASALLGRDLAEGRALVEAARAPELLAAVQEATRTHRAAHTAVALDGVGELAVRACPVAHPPFAAVVVFRDTRAERQLEQSRRALVADLAHELRTPLTVLAALAEELAESERGDDLVATLERQVQRLRTFAAELEELATLESGQVRLHPEQVDVAAIARQVVADLAGEARDAGVSLSVAGAATLDTDPVRLAQVLTNLVENGIRYNRAGGRVEVRAVDAADALQVQVEDDGIGIPEAQIPLVFQRFYRVRRGPAPKGGSGLGLAIVKHLMRALGGAVQLASREGVGTTVTLSFPRPPRWEPSPDGQPATAS